MTQRSTFKVNVGDMKAGLEGQGHSSNGNIGQEPSCSGVDHSYEPSCSGVYYTCSGLVIFQSLWNYSSYLYLNVP